MTTQQRHCLVCDAAEPFAPVYERHGFRMVRCRCGLVFQDPQPDDQVLEDSYYFDSTFSEALLGDLRDTTLEVARQKAAFLRAAGVQLDGMRVLDIGASSGAWLEVAAAAGARPTGVEIGETTAADARERGLDMRTGTLDDAMAGFGGERFDLITFWDVLEHLRDPGHELDLVRGLLRPGGLLALTFPNVEGLYPRLTHRLFARRTGVWEYPELPVHLYDFSPATARRLLARHDFTVEQVRTFATPYRFYRSTTLSPQQTGRGRRGKVLRAAFEALHLVAYPLARLTGRGNSMFVLARSGRPA
ncbi:MAG TPA: methyltransferase domain-containing protein [Mycobacteriales bacterium]|jgi:SAM-dependent methyltransferase|nr:methyltransferase domain-containing protein [Mycobacteriales bacterium]